MPTDGFDGERHARLFAPAGVLLTATGVLAGGWVGVFCVAFGIALLVLSCVSPTEGVLLIGPFAGAELRAAARRGRVWRWRAVYVVLCAVALYFSVFFPQGREAGRKLSSSVFTQGFFIGVSVAMLAYLAHVVVTVVAPVVAEEREKKRWEMLLTTDLRNREILFGKIVGRVPGLFEPLWAVLPVLAVLPLLGGVSPVLVGCAAVITVSVVGGSAALAAYSSVRLPTAEKAVNAGRGLQIGGMVFTFALLAAAFYPPAWTFPASLGRTSPVEVRHVVEWANAGNPFGTGLLMFGLGVGRTGTVEDDLLVIARRCAAFWIAVGGLLTLRAVIDLRGERLQSSAPIPGSAASRPKPVPRRPPVPDQSVRWWTEYGHLTAPQMRIVGRLGMWSYVRWFVVSLVLLAGCRWWEARYPHAWPYLGKVADVAGPLMMTVWSAVMLLVPLFMAAQQIAKERSADTLQALVLTDLSARDVVYQKWVGVLRPLRHSWVAGLCWAAAAVATGGPLKWWIALIILTAVPLLCPCWAAVGLGFSAHASNVVKAQRNLAGAVFGGGYGSAILLSVLISFVPGQTAKAFVSGMIAVVVVVAQPVLGWLAFRYAVRRLEREYD